MRIFIVVLLAVLFLGCKKDTAINYSGTWSATYTGVNDSGEWLVVLDQDGYTIAGSVYSDVFAENFTLNGSVSKTGQLYLSYGTPLSGATFTGSLTATSGTGTWVKNIDATTSYTGTWTAIKD